MKTVGIFEAKTKQRPSAIWECREEFIDRYGELPEFEIPTRETDLENKNLFDE